MPVYMMTSRQLFRRTVTINGEPTQYEFGARQPIEVEPDVAVQLLPDTVDALVFCDAKGKPLTEVPEEVQAAAKPKAAKPGSGRSTGKAKPAAE